MEPASTYQSYQNWRTTPSLWPGTQLFDALSLYPDPYKKQWGYLEKTIKCKKNNQLLIRCHCCALFWTYFFWQSVYILHQWRPAHLYKVKICFMMVSWLTFGVIISPLPKFRGPPIFLSNFLVIFINLWTVFQYI